MRDASTFERNVEKIALAAAAGIVALVVVYFFVFSPYQVERAGRQLAPLEMEEQLAEDVEQLQRKLETSEVPDRRIADFAEVFTRDFRADVLAAGDRLSILMLPGLPSELLPKGQVAVADEFDLPSPPAVTEQRLRDGFAVLDPSALAADALATLRELIGEADPPDYRYVSVTGTFDFALWNQRLDSYEIPQGWRRDRRGIARVHLLRQRLDPETGQWSEARRIDPLPTQLHYGRGVSYTQGMAEDALSNIRTQQRRIARPDLPASRRIDGGRSWFSPDLQASLTVEQRFRLDEINAQLEANRREIRSLADRLELDEPPPPPDAEGEGRNAAGEESASARVTGRTVSRESGRERRNVDEVDPLLQELRDLQRENLRLERERREIVIEADGKVGLLHYAEGGGDGTGAGVDAPPEETQAEWFNRAVRIWAHDITAEPGQTYRYKLVAGVVNPLFFEDSLSPQQREAHRDRIVLLPDESVVEEMPWSDPVRVDPALQFFLVGGNTRLGFAEIEVWRPRSGRWVVGEYSVRPGDRVGGPARTPDGGEMDLTLDVLLVDILPAAGVDAPDPVEAIYVRPEENVLESRVDALDTVSDHYRLLRLQRGVQQRHAD